MNGYEVGWCRIVYPHEPGYLVSWVQVRYPHEQSTGYQVGWVQIRTPLASGYQVGWVQVRVPYFELKLLVAGGDGSRKDGRQRPRVDDFNDLQDLCEVWELMMRKAA